MSQRCASSDSPVSKNNTSRSLTSRTKGEQMGSFCQSRYSTSNPQVRFTGNLPNSLTTFCNYQEQMILYSYQRIALSSPDAPHALGLTPNCPTKLGSFSNFQIASLPPLARGRRASRQYDSPSGVLSSKRNVRSRAMLRTLWQT